MLDSIHDEVQKFTVPVERRKAVFFKNGRLK